MEVLQNSQKFRVRRGNLTELTEVPGTVRVYECCTRTPGIVARAYRTYRSFGYGYERLTKLTEVPGAYGYGCCAELAEVPVTGHTRVNTRLKGCEKRRINWRNKYFHTLQACRTLR